MKSVQKIAKLTYNGRLFFLPGLASVPVNQRFAGTNRQNGSPPGYISEDWLRMRVLERIKIVVLAFVLILTGDRESNC